MNIDEMKNPELQEKLRDVENAEDVLAIVQEEGIELTDAQLDGIAGGGWGSSDSSLKCPYCGSTDVTDLGATSQGNPHDGNEWHCNGCDSFFTC